MEAYFHPSYKFFDRSKTIEDIAIRLLGKLLGPLPKADANFISLLNLRKLTRPASPRHLLLSATGILDSETRECPLYGSLDNLKASDIRAGPFGLSITTEPRDHLTFERVNDQDHLRILSIGSIFNQYSVQRLGFTRYQRLRKINPLNTYV